MPTSADDVFFDANSTGTCTIATGNTGARSINCTGFTGTISISIAFTVSGSVTLSTGMTWTAGGGSQVVFNGTGTLTTAGKTFSSVLLDTAGVTLTLGDALTSNGVVAVLRGTFNTAGFAITAPQINCSSSNTRVINLGASTVTLTGSSLTFFAFTTTGLTFNSGTSQINLTSSTANISSGGLTFHNVSFTGTAAGSRSISGANTFNNLTLNASATGLSQLTLSANQAVNGTLTCAGSSAIARAFVCSDTIGTARTITAAAVSANDCDFCDITIAGAAAPISPTRAGNCGGNSGITFPAAKNCFRVGAASAWAGSSSWALTSGGTGADNNFPLPQDTAVIDNNMALTGFLNIETFNISAIDASTRTTVVTLAFSPASYYGSVALGSGVTVSGASFLTFAGRGTMNFTSAGKTITFPIEVNAPGGTFRLLDAFTTTGASGGVGFTLTRGTLDLNGNTLTTAGFSSSVNNTRTLAFGTGNITVTGTSTVWDTGTTTGLTVTGTPVVNVTNNTATATTVTPGSPTESNSVSFNFTAGTYALTISTGSVRSLNFTGFSGSLNNVTRTVFGNLIISTGMTVTAGFNVHTLASTSTSVQAIRSNGRSLAFPITCNGIGGSWRLDDALSLGTRVLTITQGTFNSNSFSFTGGVSTTGGSLIMGASTFNIPGFSDFIIGSGTNVTAGTSSVIGAADAAMNLGGKTFSNITIAGGFTSTSFSAGGTATIGNLTIAPTTSLTYKPISASGIFVVNGTFSAPAPTNISFRGGIIGGSFTVASAGVVSSLDISNATFTGAATPITLTDCSDLGGNSGLTFPAARTLYFRSGTLWGNSTPPWSTTPGGAATVVYPLVQDTCIIDDSSPSSLSMNGGNNGYNVGDIDATGRTTPFTLTIGPASNGTDHYGNLQLSSSVTLTSTGSPTLTFLLPSYRPGPVLLAIPTISGWSGTQDFLLSANGRLMSTVSGPIFTLSSGRTLDLNGFTLNMLSFTSSGTPAITWSGGTIIARTGGITIPTGAVFSGTGSVILSGSAAKTFAGGNKSYDTVTQNGLGNLTITGSNTFNTLANTVQPANILFTAATTTTITNWNVNGTSGNLITIGSATAASHTLSKSSGTVEANFLSISRSIATGGATWYAGANSVDEGNNTGWLFQAAPGAGTGAFLMIF